MGGMGVGGDWCLNTAGLDAHKAEAEQTCSSGFCMTAFMSKKDMVVIFHPLIL